MIEVSQAFNLLSVLNLGHSPLYRHFCKSLYIELLKFQSDYLIHTFFSLDILKVDFQYTTYRNSSKSFHIKPKFECLLHLFIEVSQSLHPSNLLHLHDLADDVNIHLNLPNIQQIWITKNFRNAFFSNNDDY